MDWYTLRIISGKEKKVRENILFELEQAEMDGHIKNILVPTENVIQMRDGKKKLKEKVFFPGYLLIQMDMNKETKFLIENVNGVISFVGSNHKPEPLKPEEALRFMTNYDSPDGPIRVSEEAPYKVGDAVKVTDGPFIDFSGFVQEINHEKQKLKVSVSIFGRPTPVELDYLQVKMEQ